MTVFRHDPGVIDDHIQLLASFSECCCSLDHFFLAIYGALDEIDRFGMQKSKLFQLTRLLRSPASRDHGVSVRHQDLSECQSDSTIRARYEDYFHKEFWCTKFKFGAFSVPSSK